MKKLTKTISTLFLFVTTTAVAAEPTPEAKALIKAEMKKTEHLEVDALQKALNGGEPLTFIDVRQKSERPIMGLITKGDVHIPRGFLEIKTYSKVEDRDTPIVVYCGKGIRSAFAANTLKDMGYTNVKNLKGGVKAWKEAGFKTLDVPTETKAK